MSAICATSNVDHEKRVAISMHGCGSVSITRFIEKMMFRTWLLLISTIICLPFVRYDNL